MPLPTSSGGFGVDWNSGNLAEEVTRGMREAASRGFWVSTFAPYGYKKVKVQDGAKERPKLELDPPADAVVRRIFQMALKGRSVLDIVRTLNAEGIPTRNGGRWLKNTVHGMLGNEAYMGTLVWGKRSKGKAPPVRVENAVPAIVTGEEFGRVQELLRSRAPKVEHPFLAVKRRFGYAKVRYRGLAKNRERLTLLLGLTNLLAAEPRLA